VRASSETTKAFAKPELPLSGGNSDGWTGKAPPEQHQEPSQEKPEDADPDLEDDDELDDDLDEDQEPAGQDPNLPQLPQGRQPDLHLATATVFDTIRCRQIAIHLLKHSSELVLLIGIHGRGRDACESQTDVMTALGELAAFCGQANRDSTAISTFPALGREALSIKPYENVRKRRLIDRRDRR
jgi:hypothetical protein